MFVGDGVTWEGGWNRGSGSGGEKWGVVAHFKEKSITFLFWGMTIWRSEEGNVAMVICMHPITNRCSKDLCLFHSLIHTSFGS